MTSPRKNLEQAYIQNYNKRLVPEPKENQIITTACLPPYVYATGVKKFGYKTTKDKKLLLHGLSQIPLELVEANTLTELGKPELINNGRGLRWNKNVPNVYDTCLPYYSSGYYYIFYNHDEKIYTIKMMWSEELGVGEKTITSLATNFTNQSDVLNFLRRARTVGILDWLIERKNILDSRNIDKEIENAQIDALEKILP